MIHVDLFTGLGGFAYAVDQVWDNVEHVFCEIDPFCQQVINKHWEGATIYGDIRKLTADSYKKRFQEGKRHNKGANRNKPLRPFILTGGFPCQPFSQAGKRKGADDNRFLWPQMYRVIKEFEPTWIIIENVAGILSMAQFQSKAEMGSETDLFGNKTHIKTETGRGILYGIIGELEQIGYSVQVFVIPACAVNAPHRRDRVWIIANCKAGNPGSRPNKKGESSCGSSSWQQNWLEVATKFCGVDDGLPVELDGFKLSKAGHRVERLKSLGNAIVPQVAMEIMRAIKNLK